MGPYNSRMCVTPISGQDAIKSAEFSIMEELSKKKM